MNCFDGIRTCPARGRPVRGSVDVCCSRAAAKARPTYMVASQSPARRSRMQSCILCRQTAHKLNRYSRRMGPISSTTPGKNGGAAPGTYKVYFASTTSEQDEAAKESLTDADYRAGKLPAVSKTPPKSPLPAKYRSLATSDLSRDVKPGSNEINFELESH